jgi:hypothetical protein
VTTKELARAVRARHPGLRVVGVERTARPAEPDVELVAGDFASCAGLGPTAVVRAFNVLRGYREEEVAPAREALGAGLVEGGLLLEGSTDTEGHVTTAWLLRRRGGQLLNEALLFHTDFTRGFSPWLFRDWLPRDLRRGVKPGTPVFALLEAWEARAKAGGEADPRARFLSSLDAPLAATAWERANGFARWPQPA